MVGCYHILQYELLKYSPGVHLVKIILHIYIFTTCPGRTCVRDGGRQKLNDPVTFSLLWRFLQQPYNFFFVWLTVPTKQWEIEMSRLVVPQSTLYCNVFLSFGQPQSSWLLDCQFVVTDLPSPRNLNSAIRALGSHLECCKSCSPWICLSFFMWYTWNRRLRWGVGCFTYLSELHIVKIFLPYIVLPKAEGFQCFIYPISVKERWFENTFLIVVDLRCKCYYL